MRNHAIALLAPVLAAGGLLAQTQNILYYSDPSATVGVRNAFPFGSVGVRTQQLVPGGIFGGPALIQDLLAVSPLDRGGLYQVSEVVYDDFEIRMGVTTVSTLTTNWQTNNPNPTTVYRGPLRVRFLRDRWISVGLPRPYRWNPSAPGENLCVEFIQWKVGNTGAIPPDINGYFLDALVPAARNVQRAFLRGWVQTQRTTAQNVDGNGIKLGFLLNDGTFVVHGGGCKGSSGLAPAIGVPAGTWPQVGVPLRVELRDGPASSGAFLSLGFDDRMLGPIPLPFDLSPLGAPGCFVWHDNVATSPLANTSVSGAAAALLLVPANSLLIGVRIHSSWVCFDPGANFLGLTTSGYATIIVGT